MDDQQKRIEGQRLLKVEDKRIDRTIRRPNRLGQLLQPLRRLIGSRRKPLSTAEQEFKSELDFFMGVELEVLCSSIRRYSQSLHKGQMPGKMSLVRNEEVAQLKSSLEKLCIVNKEIVHKAGLVDKAITIKEGSR